MNFLKKSASTLSILTGFLFLMGPILARFHIIPALVGFGMFVSSAVIGIFCIVASIAAIKRKELQSGVLLFSIGALPLFIIGYTLSTNGGHPPINDISTDLENPPVVFDQRAPDIAVVMDAKFVDIIKASYSDLSPVYSKKDPQTVFGIVVDAAKANPHWTVYKEDSVGFVLHGYERFGIFQFTDDFTVRVLTANDGSSIIDMRSKSRDGKGDFGINAKRIRAFLSALSSKI
jgi:uncharacterized protein (DUF1499 family)